MSTVAVTGGSGKLGEQVVRELQLQGYHVISLDRRRSKKLHCRQYEIDLSDFGQVVGTLEGAEAVIHLAAIPAPMLDTNAHTFSNNVVGGYNILEAASLLGIRKVVLGSSESSYGFAWAAKPFAPFYVPLDEQHPQLPQECYGLSKVVNEATTAMFHRRNGLDVTSLRFSTIVALEEYRGLQINQPENYKRTLWSYIDLRDAVDSCIAALRHRGGQAEMLNITADDTLSNSLTVELLDRFYPDVTDRRYDYQGREAVVSNRLAKKVLGWQPKYSWKDAIDQQGTT